MIDFNKFDPNRDYNKDEASYREYSEMMDEMINIARQGLADKGTPSVDIDWMHLIGNIQGLMTSVSKWAGDWGTRQAPIGKVPSYQLARMEDLLLETAGLVRSLKEASK